jgi:G3E family GTPase
VTPAASTPVTILTGFLGAGKTTLMNHILRGNHGLRIALLVNDFGSINIDSDLVVGVQSEGAIISLANGCVCCNIREDLLAAMNEVLDRPDPPEYLVLEASGVAEPSGMVTTFANPALRERIRLDAIMCVMDASQIFAAPELMDLKLKQIAYADVLILNKTDLVGRDEIGRIRAWLDEHFHRYRLIESVNGNVPMELLLAEGRLDPARFDRDAGTDAGHDHRNVFSSFAFETNEPLSLEAVRAAAKKLPAGVYRCKGIVHSSDAPDRRAILQVVGKRVDLTLADEWGDRKPRTQLVAIAAIGTIDEHTLPDAFLSDGPRPAKVGA